MSFAFACSGGEGDSQRNGQGETLSVITTIYPLEHFARRIGGDTVEVSNLIAPGVEAHDFEPSPADIRSLDSADVIIYNGSGFEPWMDRALDAVGDGSTVVEAGKGLEEDPHVEDDADSHGEDHADPHVWLDPLNAAQQAIQIRDGLIAANPGGKSVYDSNASELLAELERLDDRYQENLTSCGISQFVTSHAAFGHLAERYGLEQIAVSGLSPESQPAPRDLANLVNTIRDLGVKFVMVEPIINSSISETLAAEAGAALLPLHPLETLTIDETASGETYFSIMETNLESLRSALECD